MATAYWRTDSRVSDIIGAQDAGWSFFQLVRVLLSEKKRDIEQRQQLAALGEDSERPQLADKDIATFLPELLEQTFRFKASHRSDFPPSEICQVNSKTVHQQKIHEITSIGCHLSGHNGPLPEAVNDILIRELKDGNGHLGRFLDLFNHRLQALRYLFRATSDYGLTNTSVDATYLGNFALGLTGNVSFRKRTITNQSAQSLIGLTGGLANRRMTIPEIKNIFLKTMNLPVLRIENYIGKWLEVDPEDYSLLGQQNQALGSKATLGTRYWDQQAAIAITIGPLDAERIHALLPQSAEHQKLVALLDWITDRRVDCRVTLQGNSPVTLVAALSSAKQDNNELNGRLRLQGDNALKDVTFTIDMTERVK